jgi:hypothetical protein
MRGFLSRKALWNGIFLTAFLTGTLSAGTPTGSHPPAKDWTVDVGPGPCDLTEGNQPCTTQTIGKGKLHKIVWRSKGAGQSLTIVVHVPEGCPAPFKKMTRVGTDSSGNALWRVDCKENRCDSGPAVKEACERSYLYDQTLDGKTCDGMIIIDK